MVEVEEQKRELVNIFEKDRFSSVCVTSVLMKNHREYGKKHLYDGKPETCWNSDQGLPQHVIAKFEQPQQIRQIVMISQGGFCPREVVLYLDSQEIERFEAQDSNLV